MDARTMYVCKKREYQCFTLSRENAEIARRVYPQLKGGRIKNILQMWPSRIALGSLYKFDELVELMARENSNV